MGVYEKFSHILRQYDSHIFLIDSLNDCMFTYGEFHKIVCNFASELSHRGVCREDRVAILLPNCVEFAATYFACIYIGAVSVPINSNLSPNEISFVVTNSKSKFLIYAPSLSDKLSSCDLQNRISLAPKHEQKNIGSQDLFLNIFSLSEDNSFVPFKNSGEDDIVAIMYTSGTTAKPKGLMHRLKSMVCNAETFAGFYEITPKIRFYHTFSMAYMAGFFNLLILPFLCGASVIIGPVFNAKMALTFWDIPIKYKANALWLVPSIMASLLRIDRGKIGEEFCSNYVQYAFVGTAPLPVKIKQEFESHYGIQVFENYGLSETLFITAEPPKIPHLSGSVGRILPGIKLRIVDQNGDECGYSKEGEVFVQTTAIMAGYLNLNSDVSCINPGDWFSTGDYGSLTDDGDLFITGRKKDIIIRGGINISPKAIEEELLRHEAVEDVCVVGIPHELYGEDIVAVLKLKPNYNFNSIKISLASFARKNLASHQQPAFYMAIDEFPVGVGGKVQKHRLREVVISKLQL